MVSLTSVVEDAEMFGMVGEIFHRSFSNSLLKLLASSEFLFSDAGIVWRMSDGVFLALSIFLVLCR